MAGIIPVAGVAAAYFRLCVEYPSLMQWICKCNMGAGGAATVVVKHRIAGIRMIVSILSDCFV